MVMHFGYLSILDEIVAFEKQFRNLGALGLLNFSDSVLVDQVESPYRNTQLLYTRQEPGIVLINHNVPVKNSSLNREVWDYMLGHVITASVTKTSESALTLFPNPSSNHILINGMKHNSNVLFEIYNLSGQAWQLPGHTSDVNLCLDLRGVPTGIYFLRYAGMAHRFLVIK